MDPDEHIAPLLDADGDGARPPHPVAKGYWLWFLTLSAAISGLLFGYDTASISSALLYLAPSLSTPERAVTTRDLSLIAAGTSLGALFGGLGAGTSADVFGRKRTIIGADVGFFVGAVWQGLSGSVASLLAARVLVGVSVGVASLVVPLYISELSPPSHRGRLVVVSVLFITLGQLLAYVLGVVLSPPLLSGDASWRWVLSLGSVPAAVQLGLMTQMPETPRWLLQRVNAAAAGRSVGLIYGLSPQSTAVARLVDDMGSGIPRRRGGIRELVGTAGNRRALVLACLLQFLQQASGINSVLYFAPTILARLGLDDPTLIALVTTAAVNAACTAVAFALIDRTGRRPTLLASLAGTVAGLLLCAVGFFAMPRKGALVVLLVGVPLFVGSYALGLGAVPWLCQSEFFPMEVRGLGTTAATATNWFWNLVIAASFLGAVEAVGAQWVLLTYAMVVAGGGVACWWIYPETKGLEMEEIEGLLRKGWGVEGR